MASSLVPESPLKVLACKWLLCCWNAGRNNDGDADADVDVDMIKVLIMMIVAENKYKSCHLLKANSKLFITWHPVLLSFHNTITQEQHTHTLWFLRWDDFSLLTCPRWHSYLPGSWASRSLSRPGAGYLPPPDVPSHSGFISKVLHLLWILTWSRTTFFLEMLYLYRKYQNETE